MNGKVHRENGHPLRFVSHGDKRVQAIARDHGWLSGINYTYVRKAKDWDQVGFLDIDWMNYGFERHLAAVKSIRPLMTVARDIVNDEDLPLILEEAAMLSAYCGYVVVVPKASALAVELNTLIPDDFLLGYSVPTRHGGTGLPLHSFKRPVHLLGGRPDVQRRLADQMPVVSVDCNRFTLDAAFGDYFDGETFRPHPTGGYERCITDSLRNINALWASYEYQRSDSDDR
jgi:hypothetical protein